MKRSKWLNLLNGLLVILLLSSCTLAPKKQDVVVVNDSEITLMTYNVENLFDTEDDLGKNDEEFLPRSKKKSPYYQNLCFTRANEYFKSECLGKDWSEKIFKRKVARLAQVITSTHQGRGPDILILEEVENINALNALADAMPQMGYQTRVLIEGPDERGIDVGLISRLPQKSSKLHKVDFEEIKYSLKSKAEVVKSRTKDQKDNVAFELSEEDTDDIDGNYHTRGILETELELPDGKSIFVLGAHLPSQRSSTGYRRVVLEKLAQIKNSLPKGSLIFSAGDYNISASEEVKEKLFAEQISKDWAVSHLIGCDSCIGTYYYHHKREWSFFDAFLFDKTMTDGTAEWQVDPKSIKIFNDHLYQVNRWGSPARFGKGKQGVGVSDHWPLLAKIKRTDNSKEIEGDKQ